MQYKSIAWLAPHCKKLASEALRYESHSCYTANLVNVHQTAPPVSSDNSHLIAAYYSFINPRRMKGWVGLVSCKLCMLSELCVHMAQMTPHGRYQVVIIAWLTYASSTCCCDESSSTEANMPLCLQSCAGQLMRSCLMQLSVISITWRMTSYH